MPARTATVNPSTPLRSRIAALLATLLIGGALSLTPAGAPATTNAAAAVTSESVAAVSMDGGGYMNCAIRTDRTLWCWGSSFTSEYMFLIDGGEVGKNGTNTPQQIGTKLWLTVSVGRATTCGIVIPTATSTSGSLYCFGANTSGVLGVSPSLLRSAREPKQVSTATDWTSVSVGDQHMCAIRINRLYCIGENSDGQLGVGDNTNRTTMTDTTNSATSVVAGEDHTCFLAGILGQPQSAYCFGANYSGQLGDTTQTNWNEFVPVSGSHTFRSLTSGRGFVCGIADVSTSFPSDAGRAYCWGNNGALSLGGGTTDGYATTPTAVSLSETFLNLVAGDDHVCGVTTNRKLFCWGNNSTSQAGEASSTINSQPHQVGTATNWALVSASSGVSCAATVATSTVPSTTSCWGDRTTLGNGIPTYINVPTKVPGTGWLVVATNGGTRCGIQGTALPGKLFCFGRNWNGEVGNGFDTLQRTLYEVPNASGWREVATGGSFTCAISGTGALYCWGDNQNGQLGDGTTVDHYAPLQVGDRTDWSGLTLGGDTACAIRGGMSVYCWGSDSDGQLGNGGVVHEAQSTPGLAFTDEDGASVAKVSLGAAHACALTTTHNLYCWGDNNAFGVGAGQLGDGTQDDQPSPVPSIPGMSFIDVSAGVSSTCGVEAGGATYCWGSNMYGNLGNGDTLPDLFFLMGMGTNSAYAGGSATKVDAGFWANCSIKRGGDAYCWGLAFGGIIPVGRDESSSTPTKIGSGFTQIDIVPSPVGGGGCGIKSDTTMWCWGFNQGNWFQNGVVDEYSTPQAIKIVYRKPVATGGAQFTGRAKKNSVLTADAPDFSGTPIPAVTYQWYRCTKAASASSASVPSTCTKITSATRSTYTLKVAEVNKYVRLLITAKNKGGTVTILTASSAKVAN